MNSKVLRPAEELKGFQRITLRPGEVKTVQLPLKASALAYWDVAKGSFKVEADRVSVMVGSSSADIRLKKSVEVAAE